MPTVGLLPTPLPPNGSDFALNASQVSPPRSPPPSDGATVSNNANGMAGDGTDAGSVDPNETSPPEKATADSGATTATAVPNNDTVGSESDPNRVRRSAPSADEKETAETQTNSKSTETTKTEGTNDQRGGAAPAPVPVPMSMASRSAYTGAASSAAAVMTQQYQQGAPPGPAPNGYYLSYPTPEPPSPAGHGSNMGMYDMGSFLPAAFLGSPFPQQQYVSSAALQPHSLQPPLSPSQKSAANASSSNVGGATNMSHIPPASPLFPRVTGTHGLLDPHRMLDFQRGTPLSPSPSYMNSPGGIPMYSPAMNYAALTQQRSSSGGVSNNNNPSDEYPGWGASNNGDNRQGYSPQMGSQGMPIPYVPGMPPRPGSTGAARSQSFDESMLPGAALQDSSQQDQGAVQGGYPPYGNTEGSGASASSAGTLFAQQAWGFGGLPPPSPHDLYNQPASPLQPRPTFGGGMSGAPPRAPSHHHPHMVAAPPYGGQYFPATSPGPPIQTTSSNKGPDGANLFIFHIPNHFTNIDMYQLFCPYGNLLSVRIMVQKETGRSRGFGFVSYDSPDAAALAIKELNGFAIGNKRLKVQHKQIRPSDHMHDRSMTPGGPSGGYGTMGAQVDGPDYGRGLSSSLPPSGPMSAMSSTSWYGNEDASHQQSVQVDVGGAPPGVVDPQQQQQQQDGTGATSPLHNMDALRQTLPDMGAGTE